MSHQIVGVILIYLQSKYFRKEIQILQSPGQLWLKSGDTAQVHCKTLEEEVSTMWYKEQSGSLRWIYRSSEFASPDGKYSSEANTAANTFSLIISNVQREDSGVYYCGLFSFMYLQPNFGNGTRLIVTDASEPSLSILVPSVPEDAELPPIIPLLCLLSDFTPPWSAVLWDTGEEASEGQTDAGAIDGNGVFSVWSLMTIPSETWNQETTCNCTAKESSTGRKIVYFNSPNTSTVAQSLCHESLIYKCRIIPLSPISCSVNRPDKQVCLHLQEIMWPLSSRTRISMDVCPQELWLKHEGTYESGT
uniref:Ig-like domain-containing protein n=1 Tax=Terrapene triunguis TaxID=2587831 RepID=A0A674J3U4_9SAUR